MGDDVASAHAPADLVELGESERVGTLDDQRVGVGDVEPGLDDRRRDEHVRVAGEEREHVALELPLGHLPVCDEEAELGAELAQVLDRLLDGLDPVVQDEGLASALVLAQERLADELLVVLAHVRADRPAATRRCLDDADVAQSGEGHVQRARDRRGREREHVHLEPELAKQLLLGDAEALLLVHDHEAEVLGGDVPREDAMRADQDVHLALRVVGEDALHLGRLAEAAHHLDGHGQVAVALPKCVQVLLREDRGRGEQQRLRAVRDRDEGGADGDFGLAEADVPADEPVHRPRRLEVLLDDLDRLALVGRLLVREARLEPLDELGVGLERDALGPLAPRVEGEQLAGQLVRARACPVLDRLPRLAAELRQRGRVTVGPHVARNLGNLLVRDVEAIVAPEGEEEVVAGDAGDRLRLEAEQLPYPVVLVHDVVSRPQVREALERPPDADVGARGPLPEDLRVREQDQVEVPEDEAAARRRDREDEAGLVRQVVPGAEHYRVQAAQHSLRPLRLAVVGEGDNDAAPALHVREEVALGLGQAACGDRGALRLEGMALARRELGQADRAAEVELAPERLADGLLRLVGLPDEVGHRERRDEIHGDRRRLALVRQRRLEQVEAALGGGVDDGLLEPVQCALGEGRERAQRLDLVAEELHPHRLAARRREDVHDPAANGELPSLLGLRDALVAGEGEALRQGLGPGLVSDPEDDRLRPRLLGRDSLRDPDSRRADEAALGQNLEGTGSLADQVRRRLRPLPQRTPRDAKRPTRSSPRNQPAASAASRACSSSGRTHDERPAAGPVERRPERAVEAAPTRAPPPDRPGTRAGARLPRTRGRRERGPVRGRGWGGP